ncbi:MAG: hypothetical protein JW832_10960 [Deltaproteobacteria bacterium]|nr:hypothetical protein [Deltaproteobacteria bacterium]
MKKIFFILLAIGMTLYMASTVNATSDKGVCEGLKGAAFGLCNAYCNAPENDCVMNPDTAICEDLRTNNEKINGSRYFPCDELIACAICSDVVGAGTVGECEERLPFECVEPLLNMGSFSCDEITTIPAASMSYNSCIINPDNNPFGVIPYCQNSIPAFVCRLFIQGTVGAPGACPAPPSCLE